MVVGSGTVVVPITPVCPLQLSQMMSIAHGERLLPGRIVESSTSSKTDENPPTRLTVKLNAEVVPAPPPCGPNSTPYSNLPKPSISMAEGFPELTRLKFAGRPETVI